MSDKPMTIYEFGCNNEKSIMLIHPSIVRWDYFEYVIPLLEKKYHVIVPALPGYDERQNTDFPGVEQIAEELGTWLMEKSIDLYAVYGCSMGGSIALLTALRQNAWISNI